MVAKARPWALGALLLTGCASAPGAATSVPDAPTEVTSSNAPKYKPSSSSPKAVPIDTDAYGAFRKAPKAIALGTKAPTFTLPDTSNAPWSLEDQLAKNPILIMFYRGDW